MQQYLAQLLNDIEEATQHVSMPFAEKEVSLHDWLTPEEEETNAPTRNLPEWTGITPDMFPPATRLTDDEVHRVLEAVKKMLEAYNCHFVLQTEVPERIQYETIRQNLNQEVKVRQWHMGFFEMCKSGTQHKTCTLGEHCQCTFYQELFKGYIHEELTPEEERVRALEIEVKHIRNKYGDDWMKYYPYHLDKKYDDENGKPYNYGFDDEQEEEDDWWRR
jgi:hypothetical protein